MESKRVKEKVKCSSGKIVQTLLKERKKVQRKEKGDLGDQRGTYSGTPFKIRTPSGHAKKAGRN